MIFWISHSKQHIRVYLYRINLPSILKCRLMVMFQVMANINTNSKSFTDETIIEIGRTAYTPPINIAHMRLTSKDLPVF